MLGDLLKDLKAWTGGKMDTLIKRMLQVWLDSDDVEAMPTELRAKAEGFLERTTPSRGWVVYEHRELDTHAVRYVGKGRPSRAWSSARTDPEHAERLRNNELEVVLVLRGLDEATALREEAIRINNHVDTGAHLYNRDIPGI